MQGFTYKILDSVVKIKRGEWDAIFADIPEGYGFYKTLEESKLKEFSFYYIIIYKEGLPFLIAPIFTAEFDATIACEGFIEKSIYFIRKIIPGFLIFSSLFCGSPFGEHGILGIRAGVQEVDSLLDTLVDILDEFSKEKNIRFIIFKDFLVKESLFLRRLLNNGFFKVNSFPNCVTELNFSSFEEYLISLSHSARKSLRRKLKEAYSKADIQVKIQGDISDIINDIYGLYENTYRAGATKFERLTKEFFINISRNLSGQAKYFLYYVNGRLAAFNLCFVHKDLFIDKFIGFDYDISNKYNLYFISWCYNVNWCLEKSIHLYQTGQTDYRAKVRLGGRLIPLYAYFKHRNPGVNFILKLLSAILKPENFDTDLKKQSDV